MKFTIDRSKWLCGKLGNGKEHTALYDPKPKRSCCLGILANSCGVSKEDLNGRNIPRTLDVYGLLPNVMKFLVEGEFLVEGKDRQRQFFYVDINDDANLTQKERERQLKKLFKEDGIQVEFKGRLNQ